MSGWHELRIKDIVVGLYDGPHATPAPSSEGPIFLGIQNIDQRGGLNLTAIRHINESDWPKWTKRVTPQENDIVFTYEATINLYAIIPKGFRGCLGRRMALLRVDHSKINHKYLYYYFFSPQWRQVINENLLSGATVDRIPLTKFPDFKVQVPSRSTQDAIALYLSNLDDLIDVNTRRIRALEEMARQLYREWFLDLKFPGNEEARMLNSGSSEFGQIPEGWEIKPFSFAVKINPRLTPGKGQANKFFGMECLQTSSLVIKNSTEFRQNTGTKFQNGDVLFARITPCLENGKTGYMFGLAVNEVALGSTEFVVLREHLLLSELIYCHVREQHFRDRAKGAMVGASGRQRVSPGFFDECLVLVPPAKLQEKFSNLIRPMFQLCYAYSQANVALSGMRDLILPKLFSGELSLVEELHDVSAHVVTESTLANSTNSERNLV